MRFLAFLPLLILPAQAAEYTFPTDQQIGRIAGTDVGVIGGIAQYMPGGASARTTIVDVTQSPYNCPTDGTTNCSTAINAAIAALAENEVAYLPDGDYYISSTIAIGQGRNNRSLRGQTRDGVRLLGNLSTLMSLGQGGGFTGTTQTVTGTKTFGSTALTVASSSGFTAGDLVQIDIANEEDNTRIQAGATPTWSQKGFRRLRKYIGQVTAVSSGLVTVTPGLPWDGTNLAVTLTLQESLPSWRLQKFGVENLTIQPSSGGSLTWPIQIEYGDQCWIYNCKLSANSGSTSEIKLTNSFRCEINKNHIVNSNGASDGKLQMLTSSRCLIVDNIGQGTSAFYYCSGNTAGNVFTFNFAPECEPFAYTSHTGHPVLDYFEGNIAQNMHADHYHGNSERLAFFRNWLTSANLDFSVVNNNTIALKRFCRKYLFAGNVLGTAGFSNYAPSFGYPNINNADSTGTMEMTAGDFPASWGLTGTVTTRTSDSVAVVTMDSSIGQMAVGHGDGNNGPCLWWNSYASNRLATEITAISGLNVTFGLSGYEEGSVMPAEGTAVVIWAGINGFQELDADVANSLVLAGNYEASAAGGGTITNALTGGDTFADSYVYASKPSFFGALSWPPIGPSTTLNSAAGYEVIPAGYRFVNESAPPAGGDSTITTGTLNVGTLNVGG